MDEKEEAPIERYPTIHNSVEILAAITSKSHERKDQECGISSSEYIKQMLMSTQERIDHLLKPGRDINARSLYGDSVSVCFRASPGIVLFQRFAPGNVYCATLTVRNTTKVSRHLKVSRDPDPFFTLEYLGSNYGATVAPGLVHVYTVKFSPAEKRDYEYRVGFIDDTDAFTVPVIAIGPRPILDIPDRIEIPATAVKISASRTILVRNLGDAPAIFSFCTDNPCFSIEPSKGVLREEESMQLTATFVSEKAGDFEAGLLLNYESGEKLCLALHSSSINCIIRIDRSTIRMEDTYLGLSRSKTLTIHNRSDYIVKFQWMQLKDENADMQRKEEYKRLFRLVHNVEVVRNVSLVHYNICMPDIHELVCQRVYADEIASLMNENFGYNHASFLFTPEEGEIWPQSSTDITVIFRAVEVGELSSVAYLEVTGREDRIPLSLHGTGKGPLFVLNVITIDLHNVYMCSMHNYEIVAANKGHICGTLIYKARPTDFGGTISVTPPALTLNPDECKSFNLSFSSNRKGDFVERVDFIVKESLEVLSLHIKGCIVCPTLHFDKSSLDFGTIALGFSRREEVCLRNLSLVPVSFSIIMMQDGDQAPLTYEEFARSEVKPSFPANPREFTITPQKGVLQAHSSLKLKVIYTANLARTGRSAIRIDIWDSDSDPVILPVSFCGAIPSLSIEPAEISIRFSFINLPYSRSINIVNNSDLDGYFHITPQIISEEIPVVYSISSHQGFLKARQSKTIDITVITKILGRQQTTLSMLTMGEQAPVTSCTIVCNGQGPVISVQPTCLHFGEIQMHREKVMDFRIINDSPILAQFKLTSDKKNSSWLVKPATGELEPNKFTDIEVKILLRDAGKYIDAINVQVLNSRSMDVKVIATGIGCSIIFEPQIFPTFDMGLLFSHQNQSLPITMRNFGTHHYQVIWSNDPEMRKQRYQNISTSRFQIEPVAVEVPANGSNIVQCKVCWDRDETVTENWYVFGQIHGKGRRELLGMSTFKATFMEPRVTFNKRVLMFRIDMCPNGEEPLQTDELIVTNQSRLNLNIQLHIDAPFYLINNEEKSVREKKIVLLDGNTAIIPVKFLPSIDRDNPYSQNYNGALWFEYDGHPKRDKIRCEGAVNFPNITLHRKDLIINCVSGSSAEETLRLTNNGPVPVMYKFLWAGESITIQRDADDVEDFVDVELSNDVENYDLYSCLCRDRKGSENHGNDDASIKTLVSSSSLLYRLQKMKPEDSLTGMHSSMLTDTCHKPRNIFLPSEMPIDTSCLSRLEDLEIFTPMDSSFGTTTKEPLDDILDIVPHEGTLVPYSSRSARFIFHGFEPMRVTAVALCEILHGPTEVINVTACADIIRYSIDREIIDFDQQLFGELCRSSFTLENRSAISLDYKINERNLISNAGKSGRAIGALTIDPKEGSMDPLSSMRIEIEFQPMLLGAFEIELELQVAHLATSIITAKGVTSYPQIYPCIPHDDIFRQSSVELGYRAIQLLTSDYIAMKREAKIQCNDTNDNGSRYQIPEYDEKILLSNSWDLISYDEIFPTVIDIEMAIDRSLAIQFIYENISLWIEKRAPQKKAVIPFLYAPGYVIDMGYIIIDHKTYYSMTIINYGPWSAETAIKKLEKKQLEKFGIHVQFKKALLKVGESALVIITWQPMSAKYTERRTEEQHSIHLEVFRGCTIPITIKGVITYPFVAINTKLLNFQNVIVGECLMMTVLVKNEGFVACYWEVKVTTIRKKQEDCPFYLNYKSDVLLPGGSDVINVYFKPRKTCYVEAKMIITVKMGLETQTVTLQGRGIESKLRISDIDINFSPTVPFAKVQERVFTIENACDHPVEFFWHHLDSLFLEEDRAVEALTRYYGVKEILLPPRKLGERIPPFLMEFYNSLMSEMARALSARAIEQESVTAPNNRNELRANTRKKSISTSRLFDRHSSTREGSKADSQREFNVRRSRRKKSAGYSSTSADSSGRDCPPMSIFSELDFPHEPPILPAGDPEKIQDLLLCYIETLRRDPNFCERMRDPVKDLFDSLEMKSIPELGTIDSSQPAKKVCVIFHGAPFTKYQETACRSAKVLQIPLLCLDNVITEGIALGDNWSSVKLREIIDEAYAKYLSVLERYRESLETAPEETKQIDDDDAVHNRETVARERSPKQPRSPKAIKSHPKATAEVDRYSEDDARELIIRFEAELARIPRWEDLKFLDPVCLYECKIQTILLLQKIFPRYTTAGLTTDKISEKSTERNQDDVFLAVEIGLLIEILRERLSSPSFKRGFVLQTLNNIFFKSDVTTLLALLSIVGYVEYSLFVTFLNSMDIYMRKMEELRELEAKRLVEEANKRIQEIDEMSLSEYELLPEDEKKLYLESTLPIKKQEALQRRMQFVQRMTELRRREKPSQQSSNVNTAKHKKGNKINKIRKTDEEKFQTSTPTARKEIRNRKEEKTEDGSKPRKQEMSKELEDITKAMNDYYSSLSTIEDVIKNWDPLRKDSPFTATSKILKTDKARDKSSVISKEQSTANEFHIWYMNSADPWKQTIYDVTVQQMSENSFAKMALAVEIPSEPDLEPKKYYILQPRDLKKRDVGNNGVFQIVSLSAMPESAFATVDSADLSAINQQENRAKRKKRSRITANKTEDVASLNPSTIESRDTGASNANVTFEELPKPRWILLPNESQKFKIRYQPEEEGVHRRSYAMSVIDGDGIAYDIKVHGVADVPRLDMDHRSIFSKIEKTKIDDMNDPTYFSDSGTYDFGSLLVFRKDKSAHRRETVFKLCNVSKIDAEVYFYLQENIPDIFIIEQEKLYIPAGRCESLKVSAGVTKLGVFTDKLHICVANNPHIQTIELRCSGSKLDIELHDKLLSFGQVLLYRRDYLYCIIQNRSPVQIFWRLTPDESSDPQISFMPINGIVKAWSDRKIEFCYHANKIGKVGMSLTFKAFLHEDDAEAVFTETLGLSGETYDVAIDINHANPIDLKHVKVGFPTSAHFTIGNRGNYEVKYVILWQEQDKLSKIASNSLITLKEDIEIRPISGSIQPQKETTIQVTFLPKNEITLKECPILRCRILDTNKHTAVVAEIPLTVSLIAYHSRSIYLSLRKISALMRKYIIELSDVALIIQLEYRFRVHPYSEMNFASLGVCAKRTMYLTVENIGQFPLHYSIQAAPVGSQSIAQVTQIKREDTIKKGPDKSTDRSVGKEKKSTRIEKSSARQISLKTPEPRSMLKIGPFTVTKTEGNVQVGEIDTVTVECYPEFVGPQEEQIIILVPGSSAEESDGKLVTLFVDSCMPGIDFQDLDAIFRESYIVDRIQNFVCPKEIGAHTVFARREKCLHFRHVSLSHTHTTNLVLHNRNAIPADVELTLPSESLTSAAVKSDVFVVMPERERVPPVSHKRFAVSFSPTLMETCCGRLEVEVELPSYLRSEKFSIKLMGQACVPEVRIVEPPNGKRERAIINFGRTLIDDSKERIFTFENVGVIPAKVIVEIYEDPNFLFTLDIHNKNLADKWDYRADVSKDRYIVVRLLPEETASLEIKFIPREIGEFEGRLRLFITDNPYENITIELKGESYAELVVLEGLELTNIKYNPVNEKRKSDSKLQRPSSGRNSIAKGPTTFPVSLIYRLDYGRCFLNKIYRRNFKIINKSTSQYLRFQWSTHPDVVFSPSIGHLKQLTCKEIVATFLSSEPVAYVDMCLDCTICAIELADFSTKSVWDDREQKVRWVAVNSDVTMQETNAEMFARKAVEPVNEPSYEIVPGTTKCIQVLLNAIVAFSKYSCLVKEISFKDTLMFQMREYVFTFSNIGIVDTEYTWQINMDEQYPMRLTGNNLRSTSRSHKSTRSKIDSSTYANQFNKDIEIKPASNCNATDLFSSTAGLTERSSDSWLGSDDLPFTINPVKGTLSPGESVECVLRFSPMEVFDYKAYLTCKIENLDPELPKLVIPVTGRSLLPYCHFDVPESDYLSGKRRDAKLPGPINYEAANDTIPENTRVIELNIVGIGETHVKKFRMINPTSDDYRFTWRDRTRRAEDEISNFHCVLPEGVALRGKQVEFAFTFLATDIGIFESFWLFSVEKYNLECLFLLVAIVREPSVYCPLVHLRMKSTVLGVNVRESISIMNNEEFQIPFQIEPNSLYSKGHLQHLKITPMTGILDAKSEQILWIEYQPTLVNESQFSIKCNVKKMKTRLTILVTTTTYDIVVSVIYVDQNGRDVRLDQDRENIIDRGKLTLKTPDNIMFKIINSSKMTMQYSWDLGMTSEIINKNMYTITMPENQGHVISESLVENYLTVTALRKTVIKDHPILLKISTGLTYRLMLRAMASKPFLEFSFNHYDFGPRYIQDITATPYHVDLRIMNLDDAPHILECKFEEKPHISVNLDVLSETIDAHSSIVIPIKFRPLDQIHYHDNLHFIINSTIEKKITVHGEGIIYKVRLVNPRDKSIDLGNIPINKTVSKKIAVINDGRAAIDLKFGLMKHLPGFEKLRQRIQACPRKIEPEDRIKDDQTRPLIPETKRLDANDVDTSFQTIEPDPSEVLEIEPAASIVLQPAKTVNIVVKYKPTRRMRPFAVKVAFQTDSMIQPLFVLRGSCIGAEFRLSRTYLPFGIVVQGCSSDAKITLLNSGDIGARFKWNTSKLPRDFSIAPATGYCSPGMDVNFIVSFRPTRQDSLIEGDGFLEIEKYKILSIKITGSCCKLPDPIDTLSFSCRVREKLMKSLNIENDTTFPWTLKPEVAGDYFIVDEILNIPSKKSATCAITYAPLVMNDEKHPHMGMLLLKLPNDREPLLYSLRGLSLAPQVLQRITRQFPAKTKYIELLPVYNWMNRQQRFECKIENLDNEKPAMNDNASVFVGNSNKMDVPGNDQRDYRMEFYSYVESKYNFKVTFVNQEGEYQFYELYYIVTKPEIIESIKLVTSVRSSVCHILRLDNPLKKRQIVYTAKCQHPYITIHDIPKTVAPFSSESISIEYHPIHPIDESAIRLDINCDEHGLFPYDLRLQATPAAAEKETRVVAMLGSSTIFSLTLNNHARETVTFAIKVDNECFTIPKTVEVPPSNSTSFDVIYEPCDVHNILATLTASSEVAGEFVFPLVGIYSLPKPQGPYTVADNAPALIPFKNIFKDTKSFEYILDNTEIFMITTSLNKIQPKQVVNIAVYLKDASNDEDKSKKDSYPITGKLLVLCTDPKVSHINWIYYLRAVCN